MSESLEEKQYSKKNYILQTLAEIVNLCMGHFASDDANQAVLDLIVLSLESPAKKDMQSKAAEATIFLDPNNNSTDITVFLNLVREIAGNPNLDTIISKIINAQPFNYQDDQILVSLEQVYNPTSQVLQKLIKPQDIKSIPPAAPVITESKADQRCFVLNESEQSLLIIHYLLSRPFFDSNVLKKATNEAIRTEIITAYVCVCRLQNKLQEMTSEQTFKLNQSRRSKHFPTLLNDITAQIKGDTTVITLFHEKYLPPLSAGRKLTYSYLEENRLVDLRLYRIYELAVAIIRSRHPLFSAIAANNQTEVDKVLRENQYKITDQDHEGYTPFLLAAKNGHIDLLKQFIPFVDPKILTNYEAGQIYYFWIRKTSAAYQSVDKSESTVPSRITELEIAFVLGAEHGHIHVVAHLLGQVPSNSGAHYMAERLAAKNGYLEIVKLLVARWPSDDTNNRQKRLNTLLWVAINNYQIAIVKQLFDESGARLEDKSSKLSTLQNRSYSRDNTRYFIECLLYVGVCLIDIQRYIDISLSDFSLLFYSAREESRRLGIFETLMNAIHPDLRENFSQNLLIGAVSEGCVDIVDWLLRTGKARVNQKDKKSGQTALSQLTNPKITLQNRIQMAERLIGHYGADPVDAEKLARQLLTVGSTSLGNSNLENEIKQQAQRFRDLYNDYYSIQIKILHERGFILPDNKTDSPKERIDKENDKLIAQLKTYRDSSNTLWSRLSTEKEAVLSNTIYHQILFLDLCNPFTICEIVEKFLTEQTMPIKDLEFKKILENIISLKPKAETESTPKEPETSAKPPPFRVIFEQMFSQNSGQQVKSSTIVGIESSSNISSSSSTSTSVVPAEKETSPAELKTGPDQTYAKLRERIGEKEEMSREKRNQLPTVTEHPKSVTVSKEPTIQKDQLEQTEIQNNGDDRSSQVSQIAQLN